MANQKRNKCAPIPSLYEVPSGETYCGNAGRDAGSEEAEIAGQRDHPKYALSPREGRTSLPR
jgi:hypothetical protein